MILLSRKGVKRKCLLKIEEMEVELEELKNIEFSTDDTTGNHESRAEYTENHYRRVRYQE